MTRKPNVYERLRAAEADRDALKAEVSRLREGVMHFLKYEIAIENNRDVDAMLAYADAAIIFRSTKGLK